MKKIEGNLSAAGQKIGIVAARFNEFITSRLLGGAEDSFIRHGGEAENLEVAWVPGSFEIPLIAKKMAQSGKYDAIVCLGAVIRGATPHFDMGYSPPIPSSRPWKGPAPKPETRASMP